MRTICGVTTGGRGRHSSTTLPQQGPYVITPEHGRTIGHSSSAGMPLYEGKQATEDVVVTWVEDDEIRVHELDMSEGKPGPVFDYVLKRQSPIRRTHSSIQNEVKRSEDTHFLDARKSD